MAHRDIYSHDVTYLRSTSLASIPLGCAVRKSITGSMARYRIELIGLFSPLYPPILIGLLTGFFHRNNYRHQHPRPPSHVGRLQTHIRKHGNQACPYRIAAPGTARSREPDRAVDRNRPTQRPGPPARIQRRASAEALGWCAENRRDE